MGQTCSSAWGGIDGLPSLTTQEPQQRGNDPVHAGRPDRSSSKDSDISLRRVSSRAPPVVNIDFGGPKPPPPPPLVPTAENVYDLTESKHDVCPTCLEDYTLDNPEITSACGHTFHLACIYEWLERNPHCPMCGKRMIFDGMDHD
mmetsp:Transcript_8376/g.17057  ORF Transcript_8376/g.17057 Transcript_8376/m.17057 type:complete len:145 (-) Transcript_8376:2246-2680(-)